MNKEIPPGIMHEPKPMAWAEATPLSEHKKREAAGIKAEIVPVGSRKEPLPLSRATTDLRRAYPYIFDCAAYVKSRCPEKIETDLFYSRFTMPYDVFLDYCLDYCTEQTDYLKNEIYKLMAGQPAKYIKVSPERTVFAQPVVIAFSHTDLKTGKEKRITNIGHDAKVDMVQVQIIKELLDVSHGWLNLPKAFYAKTRHFYNRMQENIGEVLKVKNDYRASINLVKSRATAPITTREAARFFSVMVGQANLVKELNPEQGGFYKIYLAFEYILANKKKGITNQIYDFLKLCEKCAPDYVQAVEDKLYFHKSKEAFRYGLIMSGFISMLPENERRIIGIDKMEMRSKEEISVDFFPADQRHF